MPSRLVQVFTHCVLLLLWAALVALPVASADSDGPVSGIPVVDVGADHVDAQGFATVVVTGPTRRLTIDQIAAGEGDRKITDGRIVSGLADFFGETDYWIGFRLWNDSGDPVTRIISMDDWFHPDIDFYEQTASGWRETRRGSAYAKLLGADAFIPNVRVELQPGEARTYWIAIPWRAGGWSSSVHVQDLTTFDRAKWRLVFVSSAFFGAFAALILYNLFLLGIQRKRIYFFYGASATLTLLYVAVYTGLSVFVVSLVPDAIFGIYAFAVVGASAFSLLFTRRLLGVDRHFPRLSKVLTAVVWVLLLSALAGLRVDQMKYLALVSFLVILFVGVISWKRRVRYSREFVLIYSVFLAGFTTFALVNFGVLTSNFVTRYGFIFGSLVELTGFSALLAYRIRALQQEADRLSVTDTLTGLPNRRLFGDRLHQEVAKSQSTGVCTALMLIDLDRFKEVNDSFGHEVGDELLIEAANRLRSCIRNYDTVARLGGDEFAVILSEVDDVIVVGSIAQSIVDSLSKEFTITDRSLFVSASIGVTVCPTDGTDPSDLIRYADQAMYWAKTDGRSRFRFFTATMQQASQERTHLATDLRDALARQQLTVHYQAIVDLASDRITKAEALLRWEHLLTVAVDAVDVVIVDADGVDVARALSA